MSGIEDQQSFERCVDKGFEALGEKRDSFPVFKEALRKNILNETKKGLLEVGVHADVLVHVLDKFFGRNHDQFDVTDEKISKILTIFKTANNKSLDTVNLSVAAGIIEKAFRNYNTDLQNYREQYLEVKETAIKSLVDCHFDAKNMVLSDYRSRIEEYGDSQGMPKRQVKNIIAYFEKTKDAIFSAGYKKVKEIPEIELNQRLRHQINLIGRRGISGHFTKSQIDYLQGLSVAFITANIDEMEKKKNH